MQDKTSRNTNEQESGNEAIRRRAPAPTAAPVGYVDEREAGRLLGVAPATLRIWRCTGRYALPYLKIGHRIAYDPADIEAFIKAGRRDPAVASN